MKPAPKVEKEVCTVCGLDWKRHGKEPTLEMCVELLKADLVAALAAVPVPQYWVTRTSGDQTGSGTQ